MVFQNWQQVVEFYGEHGQVLEGETAEALADAALERGEVIPLEGRAGYRKVD